MREAISVAVFAHNEAVNIHNSLSALLAAGLEPNDEVHVVVNGSKDGTAEVVEMVRDPRIHLHIVDFGDKANAWNFYTHTLADPSRDHIFMDGDIRPRKGAISSLVASLRENPSALAASALPVGGRRSRSWAQQILQHHGLPGNLYCLRSATVRRIRSIPFYLPVGFIGDDTLLRWCLLRDFEPFGAIDLVRIQPSAGAFFEYDSFPILTSAGVGSMFRRHRRYALRDLQMNLVVARMKSHGLKGIPPYVGELYRAARITTALQGKVRLRSLFFVTAYRHARRNVDHVPTDRPWEAIFTRDADSRRGVSHRT